MRARIAIIVSLFCLALPALAQSSSSPKDPPAPSAGASAPQATIIDGIAARVGNDVVTESEVRELESYQHLIDGEVQSRAQVVEELVNQWIVRTEAATATFPHPTASEVDLEFQTLIKQFPSSEQFQTRLAQVGLTQDQTRSILERQLYYVRYLDYKFHAAAQVTSAEIQAYYQNELLPQLQKRGLAIPPLNQVNASIRQLLTQEEINKKAAQWLEEAKAKLRVVIQPPGGGG
ncbi:MAG TPA: hypothetical protein VGR81_03000 [Candidatus Acidoferrales bacterium]|nr:hypothetical protein [Candidatus Acidoferrales bacterium]